jgi:hypothetical protein
MYRPVVNQDSDVDKRKQIHNQTVNYEIDKIKQR